MYFHLSGTHLLVEWKDEKSKKYYDKYIPMLAIYIHNHSSDKFVPPYHIGYFINGGRQKLMAGYIYDTYYIFKD